MRVMKRQHIRLRPLRRSRRWDELVRPVRVLRKRALEVLHEALRRVCPALLERALEYAHVAAELDLPEAVLVHVFVFVETGFPPLLRQHARTVRPRLVRPRLHDVAETTFGRLAVRRDVDDVLELRMVEQEAI